MAAGSLAGGDMAFLRPGHQRRGGNAKYQGGLEAIKVPDALCLHGPDKTESAFRR